MRLSNIAPLVGVVAVLMAPVCAQAAQQLSLSFTGAGSFSEGLVPYSGVPAPSGSFTGPVTLNLSISDYLTSPYVDHFSIQWADPSIAGPYRTGWEGKGLSPSANPFLVGFFSTVALTDTGGSIQIRPSSGYVGFFDGGFSLDLNYALSIPHPVASSYLDGVSGLGSVRFTINRDVDPTIGPFDASGGGAFTVSSLEARAPEPATWALLLVGFFSLGSALRAQRGRASARSAA